jgi:hypothetical protein
MRGVLAVMCGVHVTLAGCAVRTTTARPSELAAHAQTFAAAGRAELIRSTGNVVISADERVEVRIREGDLQRSATMTVRELVEGCKLDGPDPGCLARQAIDEPVLRHRERKLDSSSATKVVGFGAIGGLIGYCAAECQDDGSLQRGFGYTAAFVGGFVVLSLVAAMLGGND